MRTRNLVMLAALLTIALAGCSDSDGGDESADSPDVRSTDIFGESMPYCADLWVAGQTIPEDYTGCYDEDDDTVMAAASYQCEDGRDFISHPPGFGFPGGPVKLTPPGLDEPDTNAADYREMYDACMSGDDTAGSETSPSTSDDDASFDDGVLTTPEIKIRVTRHEVIKAGLKGNEYGDKPVIAFWYEISNLTDDDIDPMEWIFVMKAIQDNNPNAVNELEVGALPDDSFLDSQMETIKKGGTVENAVAYELDDLSTPVDLVATQDFDEVIGKTTYEIR